MDRRSLRRWAPVAALCLAALSLTAFQVRPDMPILPTGIARLMDDVGAAQSFDYYALKAQGVDLAAMNTQAEAWLKVRAGVSPEGRGGRCVTEAEQYVLTGLKTAADAPDEATWRADHAMADAGIARWRAFRIQLMDGEPVADPPFAHVAERVAGIAEAPDPRARDLLRRAAEDQFLRYSEPDDPRQAWAAGLTPGALTRVWRVIGGETCRQDSANAAWLDEQITRFGWFDIPTFGEAADTSAWLIAQHNDRDPAFQQRVLAILEPLAASGGTSPSNYAYLHDRVAVNTGRPQRYGTQGRCTERNVWTPREIEDRDLLDDRRVAAGIGPMADYNASMNRRCASFGGG
jgi:hypothetical protein